MTVSEIEKKIGSSIGVFWLLVSIISGLLGVYAGVQYEAGQAAIAVGNLKDSYAAALQQAEARRAEAAARGNLVEKDFMGRLSNLKITNTTIHQTLKQETQKLVYTSCVLPDEGIDLLNKHINEVNLRLVSEGSEK